MSELQKVDTEKALMDYVNEKEFYEVNGKKIPSAKVVITEGVRKGISVEILDRKRDEYGVEVVVRAKLPDGTYTDEWVRMDFLTEALRLFYQKMFAKIKRREVSREDIEIIGYVDSPFGQIPQFKAQWLNIEYQNELIRTYTFLPRIVTTKAKNRAILQLLGYEFRDKEEIEQEEQEVEEVAKQDKITEAQLKKLYVEIKKYAEKVGKDPEEVKQSIKNTFEVEHLTDLRKDEASELISKLMSYQLKKKG